MTKVDLAIIGGGPAGLSSALCFARLKRPTIVFDSREYRNKSSTKGHTIPGFDGSDPVTYKQASKRDINKYPWVTIMDHKVVKIDKDDTSTCSLFKITVEGGASWSARKVILATGLQDHLVDIPGLQDQWGKRAIHCIYCDGTETSPYPIGFLITKETLRWNDKIIESAIKLWSSLQNPQVIFLTHGLSLDVPEELRMSGLEPYLPLIKKKGWQVDCRSISRIDSRSNGLSVLFDGNSSNNRLEIGYIVTFPSRFTSNKDAIPILTTQLLTTPLDPMGTIPPLGSDADRRPVMPPRMGDDPRTGVRGLFWAGNAGSLLANVNVAVAQGQAAASVVAEELGREDMEDLHRGI